MRTIVTLALAAALGACGSDNLGELCVTQGDGFDIDQVSTLEDNWGWEGLRDAIVLSTTAPAEDGTWRVGSVQVLVMLPTAEYSSYADDAELTVEIYDSPTPGMGSHYSRTQTLRRDALTWSNHTFDAIPTGPVFDDGSYYTYTSYKRAWWTFDFTSVIPESGMASLTYAVGLRWSKTLYPLVAYSQFDRPCGPNWTNYDDAYPTHSYTGDGWGSNGDRFQGDTCNWPMLKVGIERREPCE